MMTPIEQARAYLRKVDAAVEGHNGSAECFHVAGILRHGFSLSLTDAMIAIGEWNQRCLPPWSDRDLIRKLCEVDKSAPARGHGYLLSTPRSVGEVTYNAIGAPPEGIADATRTFLRSVFREGEKACLVSGIIDDEGRAVPSGAGTSLTRETWLDKLDKHDGDPNKLLHGSNVKGAFVRINPTSGGSDSDVQCYRHALLEFDALSTERQWSAIVESNVPTACILHSGGRSLHAWVRVDAADIQEFRVRVAYLMEYFSEQQPDKQCTNPSRFSRLPGFRRGEQMQKLLRVGGGAATWTDWVESHAQPKEQLPPIIKLKDFIENCSPKPPVLIDGILHKGCKLIVGGTSKSHKTWALLDLGLSVASGVEWMGRKCEAAPVLYVNFELHDWAMGDRISALCTAKNYRGSGNIGNNFFAWNLRGHSRGFDLLRPLMLAQMENLQFGLIILDPAYKVLGDADENSNDDINRLLNAFEQLSRETGAAVVLAHHFAKGNASGKEAVDRMSGAGSWARDPDALLVLTPHEEEDSFTVDPILRNFPRMDRWCVTWDFPLLRVSDDLNPDDLKGAEKPDDKKATPSTFTARDVCEALGENAWGFGAAVQHIAGTLGCSERTAKRKLRELRTSKLVIVDGVGQYRVA
jgi:RecA-family ATPase